MGIINDRIKRYFRSKLLIEIGCINSRCLTLATISFTIPSRMALTHNRGLERRLDFLLPQSLEINMTSKEGMIPDILCSSYTQPLCRISIQELSEQITSV